MYVIIVGCGRMGARLALELSALDHDVVVIDKEKNAFRRLGSGFNGLTILGTGIDVDVLNKAGVDKADALVALADQDNVNIMVAQVAKDVCRVPKVIARVFDPEREYSYKEFGLETINPTVDGIAHIVSAITPAGIIRHRLSFLGAGDVEVMEMKINERQAGLKVSGLQIPAKFKIFGIIRRMETLIPDKETALEKGDIMLAVVRLDAVATVEDILVGSTR